MPKAGNTTARGYGNAHQRKREALAPTVKAGKAYCAELVCLMPDRWIEPGTPWDLAHDRAAGPGHYLGAAHRRCNRAEGARFRHGKSRGTPRRWAL